MSKQGFRGILTYLDHLAGDRAANAKHGSDAVMWIRRNLTDAVIAGLTSGQRDRLERTLSAALGALRARVLSDQGFQVREWRPTNTKQPGVRKICGSGRFYDWDTHLPGWRDHLYRLTRVQEDGTRREWFVSEPYDLDEDGLRSLVKLLDAGWRVRVDAEWALHYPGSTVRVSISTREAKP